MPEGNLVIVRSPCVQKDSTWRDILANEFNKAEFTLGLQPQKPHEGKLLWAPDPELFKCNAKTCTS